jgi:hypothetical protein
MTDDSQPTFALPTDSRYVTSAIGFAGTIDECDFFAATASGLPDAALGTTTERRMRNSDDLEHLNRSIPRSHSDRSRSRPLGRQLAGQNRHYVDRGEARRGR